MILADKIIDLRKKNGWSQEELAEQLGVTRQAVSKWEGAQSVPDLDKVLLMSRVFGVSTDYLLKDEVEATEPLAGPGPAAGEGDPPARRVSLAEASEFLALKQASAPYTALGVLLCILSPSPLLFLNAAQEFGKIALSEDMACGVGLAALLVTVASAVAVFLYWGGKAKPFEYLDRERIDTEYGVSGLAREWQRKLQGRRTAFSILGVCLCILSALPLMAVAAVSGDEFRMIAALCLLLLLVGVGAVLLVSVSIPWESTEKLLQEGDYTWRKKRAGPVKSAIAAAYWLVVVALFLALGLHRGSWELAGVIFPVAGVLFAALVVLGNALTDRQKD